MKKSLLFILIIFILIAISLSFKYKLNKDLSQPVSAPSAKPSLTPPISDMQSSAITNRKTSLSLFVPYWALPASEIETNGFDKIIYFGIKPDKEGISNTQEDEKQLEKFNGLLPDGTQKSLALRMIDSQENRSLLSDISLQQKIVDQTVEIARKNNMNGIVLDLELTAIPFDSTIKQINKFTGEFYTASKKNNLSFALALYGDSFYRPRPFDIKTLSKNADEIMIMAYDLHKARGNPGPNFPLLGREKFGYDLVQMTNDFLQVVKPQKITVIFGLYGYDWIVDEKKKAIEQAQALTYIQIKQKFIDKCEFTKCVLNRDKEAAETQINYTDKDNKDHIIWFEDMESIKQKKEYLRQKGINSFAYWAYPYF